MRLFILLLLLSTTTWGKTMKILTLYHSPDGQTLKLAKAISQGVSDTGATSELKSITEIKPKDLSNYDAIAFGSPIYFGSMSGEMKSFLDKTLELWSDNKLVNIPATVFLSAGSGAGQDLAIMNIWSTLASHGMLLVPIGPEGGRNPLGAVLAKDSDEAKVLELARKQGQKLATIAGKMNTQITLPQAPNPVGNYRPYKISGKLIYINQIALVDGKVLNPGVIGKSVSMEKAKEATQAATLNVLAVLKSAVGGNLDNVKQAVQLTGYFNTVPDFKDHSVLMNES